MSETREIPDRASYVEAVFGHGGILAGEWTSYRPRAGQVALAHAVDAALRDRAHLLAEGPTGTGKSLAYSVPATYYAALEGRTVVIVTANIALQEQLVAKDLPLLARILPWAFTFELAKGRNNYLCVSKFYDGEVARQRGLFRDQAPSKRTVDVVQAWAEDQIERGLEGGATGDVSTLSIEPPQDVWREFSVAPDECKRKKCRFASECFALEAQERMKRAHVIVTNYHMLMADLAVYAETELDKVLPAFDVAILDEAHKAADVARDFFGFKISNESIRRTVRHLKKDAQSRGTIDPANASGDLALAETVERTATQAFYVLARMKANKERYNVRLRYPLIGESHDIDPHAKPEELDAVAKLLAALETLCMVFERRIIATEGHPDQQAQWENDLVSAAKLHSRLRRAFTLEGSEAVYFLEEEGEGSKHPKLYLSSKLVAVDRVLEKVLFEHTKNSENKADKTVIVGPKTSVVLTSATLAADKRFDFCAREVGAPEYATLIAESPFDWENQALFIVPEGMPEPNDAKFPDAVAKAFNEIVDMAKGRTLGLFTSRRVLGMTYDRAIGRGYRILRQGDAPRTQLIEEFKRDVSSVLMGNESFWAGVDVPGESLSVVVIDRLPFPTPDDPILDVISKRDRDWFFNYAIPRSIIQIKQGFGRLIRTTSDRGVVVCLDSRLTSKRYGKQFLRSLPPCPKTTKLEAIAEWLSKPVPERVEVAPPDPFEGLEASAPPPLCAIANNEDEETCKKCDKLCPDKARLIREAVREHDERSPVVDPFEGVDEDPFEGANDPDLEFPPPPRNSPPDPFEGLDGDDFIPF